MKIPTHFYARLFIASFLTIVAVACNKEDDVTTNTSASLGELSDHLIFLSATKINGESPAAPSIASSLKFSIKDTLHLVTGIEIPIEFLHNKDTDVDGAYIQVISTIPGSIGGSFAPYYIKVPELLNTEESDSISVVMVGVDDDVELNSTFQIKITPYNESGVPLDQTILPVKLDTQTENVSANVACGLVGYYWSWFMTNTMTRENGYFKFVSGPDFVFSVAQELKGCCEDGVSITGAACELGNPQTERTLVFNTYYQESYKSFEFFDNRTYRAHSKIHVANPNPEESNFCGSGGGEVDERISGTYFEGNWTVDETAVPQLDDVFHRDKFNFLHLQNTYVSDPFTTGDPGGVIIQLTCTNLTLVWPDYEGLGDHLVKQYYRVADDYSKWYQFH